MTWVSFCHCFHFSKAFQDPFKLPSSRTKSVILPPSLFLHSLCFSNTGLVFIPRIHYLHSPQSFRSSLRHDQLSESSLFILFKTVIIMSCTWLSSHHSPSTHSCLLFIVSFDRSAVLEGLFYLSFSSVHPQSRTTPGTSLPLSICWTKEQPYHCLQSFKGCK